MKKIELFRNSHALKIFAAKLSNWPFKKAILIICSFFLIQQAAAQDIWDANLFEVENQPPPRHPFSLTGDYLSVAKAGFRTPGLHGRTLTYKQWDAAFAYTHPFNESCGLIFGSGWVGTEVNMTDNPDFDETLFNYVNFSVGGFTKAFPDWTWTLTLAIFLDTESFSLIDYALYQGVLWGRYEACKYLELDFGLITEIGLHKDKVWPILGFIYIPSENWRLNAIYPINISIEYDFRRCWTAAASIRFLRNRHRVKDTEPNSQGIFEYRTLGAEADLIFHPFDWISVKGFLGSTLGGDFEITDRNDNNSIHYKFRGSFYAGASAVLSF